MASIIDDDALIDHWHLNEVRTEETVENEGESCGGNPDDAKGHDEFDFGVTLCSTQVWCDFLKVPPHPLPPPQNK